MKQLSLREIKQIEFDLLKRFVSFCREHDIKYFLSNGTLLGAVKYHGFIPWDDDVDVLVPRADYDKLVAAFRDDERYKLCSAERNPTYGFPFAKLCDMTTRKEELNIDNGMTLGVDIDIFPLDFWDDDLSRARREVKQIHRNMFLLNLAKLARADSAHPIKRLVKWIPMFFCKLLGKRYFIRRINRLCNQPKQMGSRYVGCKSWCIYGERELIPAEVFSESVEVEFEGEHFCAPIGYDHYLRRLYGDYECDPPPEKQQTHHRYTAYRVADQDRSI